MSWKLDPKREQIVLLPFDFSQAATEALATARDFVASPAWLWVLHVIPPIEITSPGFLMHQVSPDTLREQADTALAKALSDAGFGEVRRRIAMGDPASEIIDVAREIEAELIVIPSRGRTGLTRWMIGSVAEKVVRQAPCPVLVLPIRGEEQDS
jgi:nucleotide-binding universal stress UspA family protein